MSKLSGELAKMDDKNILKRLEKLERTVKGIQNQTLSINSLEELTDNLGDQRAGNFLATNSDSGYPDDNDYTGCFMSADGYTIGSANYSIGGMNNGTLQWGAKNSDGGFIAGGGAVEIGESGINIYQTTVGESEKIKFYDSSGQSCGIFYSRYNSDTGRNTVYVYAQDAGTLNAVRIVLSAAGQSATGYVQIDPQEIVIYSEEIRVGAAGYSSLSNEGLIYSSSYTPTLTSVQNIASAEVSGTTAYFTRVGNNVSVFGQIDMATAAAGASEVGISLPIASNLAASYQCTGVGANSTNNTVCRILADSTNNRAKMNFTAIGTSAVGYSFNFSYVIL